MDAPLFDADQHFYEPRDVFARYIEPAFAERAVHAVTQPDGSEIVVVDGRRVTTVGTVTYDAFPKPGSGRQLIKSHKGVRQGSAADTLFEAVRPEYRDRDTRLEVMDQQGVEACLLFSSIAVVVEHFIEDPLLLYAHLSAFNRWLCDEWGYRHLDRIYGVPILSLRDLRYAVEELERCLTRGARVISLKCGPAYGRSPGDPYFDPFWARVNEAGVSVALHVDEPGYNEAIAATWGHLANPAVFEQSAWQWTNCYVDRPIMDTVSALIFDNLFGRYPDITVVSVENGAGWVPYLVPRMDKMRAAQGPWIGGRLTAKPSSLFREHVLVTPYPEDQLEPVLSVVGSESLVMGSDWPHPEGFAQPADFVERVRSLPDADQHRILHANGERLMRA
jgi:predicted TIM-barrel fold metal-dependent hydrolase